MVQELEWAFREFKTMPFPHAARNEELGTLHVELADLDGFTAGLITSLLAGDKAAKFRLIVDTELRQRLEAYLAAGRDETDLAGEYLRYIDRIDQLVQLAKST